MHGVALENNYLKGETLGADYRKAVVETEDFTSDYIQEMQYIMNLELNFVNNNDMKLGNYDLALKGFENVIRVRPDHSFGYYYASKCHGNMGNQDKADSYINSAQKHGETEFWKKYIEYFKMPWPFIMSKEQDIKRIEYC